MGNAREEASKSMAVLERELYRVKQTVSTSRELQEALKDLVARTSELQSMVNEKHELQAAFNQQALEKPLIPLFSELQGQLEELDKTLDTFRRERSTVKNFLEGLRNYQYYRFDRAKEGATFLRAALRKFKAPAFSVKPSIIGLGDLEGMARALELEALSPTTQFALPGKKVERFLEFVAQRRAYDQYWLSCPSFKCCVKAPNELYVEADNMKLKALNVLSLEAGLKAAEK